MGAKNENLKNTGEIVSDDILNKSENKIIKDKLNEIHKFLIEHNIDKDGLDLDKSENKNNSFESEEERKVEELLINKKEKIGTSLTGLTALLKYFEKKEEKKKLEIKKEEGFLKSIIKEINEEKLGKIEEIEKPKNLGDLSLEYSAYYNSVENIDKKIKESFSTNKITINNLNIENEKNSNELIFQNSLLDINSFNLDKKINKELNNLFKKEETDINTAINESSEIQQNYFKKENKIKEELEDTQIEKKDILLSYKFILSDIGKVSEGLDYVKKYGNTLSEEIILINSLLNGEKKSDTYLKKLKDYKKSIIEKKEDYKSILEDYNEQLKELNSDLEDINEEKKDNESKYKKLLKKQEENTNYLNKEINDNYINIEKLFESYNALNKDYVIKKENKLEIGKKEKNEILEMIGKAKKMKKSFPDEYKNFKNTIGDVLKDGELTLGDFNPLTPNDIVTIKKSFKKLEKLYEEKENSINTKIYNCLENIGNDVFSTSIKNYIKNKEGKKSEIEELYSLLENLKHQKDLLKQININEKHNKTYNNFLKEVEDDISSNYGKKIVDIREKIKYFNNKIYNHEGWDSITMRDSKEIRIELGEIKTIISKIRKTKLNERYTTKINNLLQKQLNGTIDNLDISDDFIENYIEKRKHLGVKREETNKIVKLRLILETIEGNIGDKEKTKEIFESIETESEIFNRIKNKKEILYKLFKESKFKNSEEGKKLHKYMIAKVNNFSEKSSSIELKNLEGYIEQATSFLKSYQGINNKNNDLSDDKRDEYEKMLFEALSVKGKLKIEEKSIKLINDLAIELGEGRDEIQKSIKKLENIISLKLDDSDFIKGKELLIKLKKINPLLYLRILGNIKKLGKNNLKIGINFWENTLANKINNGYSELYNINYDKLQKNSLNVLLKTTNKIDEKEELNDKQIEGKLNEGIEGGKKIPFSNNSEKAKINEQKALLIFYKIHKNNEAWTNFSDKEINLAKQIIEYARKENIFGDIRVINKLRKLSGINYTDNTKKITIEEETKTELELQKLFKDNNKPYKDGYLKGVYSRDNLLRKVEISDFEKSFKEAINKNNKQNNSLKYFIGKNPVATASYFKYFIDNKNNDTLTIGEQLMLGKMYLGTLSKDTLSKDTRKIITEASGGVDFMTEMGKNFGKQGLERLIETLKNKNFSGIEKNKLDDIKKEILAKIDLLGLTADEKEYFLKILKNSDLTPKELENINKRVENINTYKKTLLKSIEGQLLEGKEEDKFIKGLNKYFQKKDIDIKGLKKYFKDNIKEKSIKKIINEISKLNIIKEQEKNTLMSIVAKTYIKHNKEKGKKEGNLFNKSVEIANKSNENVSNSKSQMNTIAHIEDEAENLSTVTNEDVAKIKDSKDYKEREKEIKEEAEKQKIDKNTTIEEIQAQIEKSNTNSDINTVIANETVASLVKKKILKKDDEVVKKIQKQTDKAIKDIIKIASENPNKHKDLVKILKKHKKILIEKEKGNLSKAEKRTLDRLNSYDLDKPSMPVIVLNKERNEIISKLENSENGEISINNKIYIASKNKNGIALLDTENNELVTLENNGFNETVKLTQNEKDKIGKSPEGISGFADFRRMMVDLNIADELWNLREDIFLNITNVIPDFKLEKNKYLSTKNQIVFLNTILKVTGKETSNSGLLNDVKTVFKKENLSNGGINQTVDTNIYGDSEIGGIFINEYKTRGDMKEFKYTKFRNAIKYGFDKEKGVKKS